MYKSTLLLILGLYSIAINAQILKDFKSDGCSMYPENKAVVNDNSWYHCCVNHDIDYWMGGTKKQRLRSDLRLKKCVEKISPFNAEIMFQGVRIGGRPGTGLPWQWGYGFTPNINYSKLHERDYRQIYQQFPTIIDALYEIKDKLDIYQKSMILSRFNRRYFEVAQLAKIPLEQYEQDKQMISERFPSLLEE